MKCACKGCPNESEISWRNRFMDGYCDDPCTLRRHDLPSLDGPFHGGEVTTFLNAAMVAHDLIVGYGSDITGETIETRIDELIAVEWLPEMYDEEFGEFFAAVSDEVENELRRIGFE